MKKYLYHKDHEPKLFDLHEEPEGWVDSPAKLSVKEAEKVSEELSPSLDEELGKVKKKAKK